MNIYSCQDMMRAFGLKRWQYNRFLTVYDLAPEERIGAAAGRGSRYIFTQDDVVLFAIALRMREQGFTPPTIISVLKVTRSMQAGEVPKRSIFLSGDGKATTNSYEHYYQFDLIDFEQEIVAKLSFVDVLSQ